MMKIRNQIKYWYRKYVPEIIRKIIRKSVPFWIELRFFKIQTKKFDFDVQGHGEAKKLLEICEDLNISDGYYVDIGASDGWSSSSTFTFAKSKNFSGLSIELDDKKFKKMQYIYKDFQNAHLSKTKITKTITNLKKDDLTVDEYLKDIRPYLNAEHRELIIKAMYYVAGSDGHLDDKESELLMYTAKVLEMTPAHIKGVLSELDKSSNN